MPSGIRATVEFAAADVCPLVSLSRRAAATIDAIAVAEPEAEAADAPSPTRVVEFSMDRTLDALDDPPADVTPIFSHGATTRYRLSRDADVDCPRTRLCALGCPVVRHEIREGTLTLTFYAADYDQLRYVVADLRERFPDMDIKRFVRSPAGGTLGDAVFIDPSRLTDRQYEVLETAYEMGYFERPRRANGTEVAAALDIDPSTFSEHLAAAQSKIFADFF